MWDLLAEGWPIGVIAVLFYIYLVDEKAKK
jgi:hypothetical protein